MPKLPSISGLRLVKTLEKISFKISRQSGSHVILIKNSVRIVVPVHSGKKIKPGLLRAIIRESGLTRENFIKLLRKDSKK